MVTAVHQVDSLNDLREFVNETLCEHNQLQIDAFQLTERVLRRSGRPCGIFFCLHGPRAVKFTAIWETDKNRVLFYGPTGERFQKTQLSDAPSLGASESGHLQHAAA